MRLLTALVPAAIFALASCPAPSAGQTRPVAPVNYESAAREVMVHIQTSFYLPEDGLYANSLSKRQPDYMWGNGVMFSALVAAARHQPQTYSPLMERFFGSMDRYWDTQTKIPGYEPAPTRGGGNDKYYDDNAWMVLTYVEAFEQTSQAKYLQRAQQTLDFVLSGCDERLGGGIWWHERHKDGTKNTCANAPAALGCLRIARHLPADQARDRVAMAKKLVDWTNRHLRTEDGLYADRIYVETAKVVNGKLTYNTGLMIRALYALHQATGDENYLAQARQSMQAADWFLDKTTHAYRDSVKWSHLLVEADLEMYRATKAQYLLERAANNADFQYATWKRKPPESLIDNASIARTLWLMADASRPAQVP
jgi:rhamnogalacturonyl hydrolase YesR